MVREGERAKGSAEAVHQAMAQRAVADSRLRIRKLGRTAAEESALLELLDGWPFSDGRRGCAFFRRYLEHDPRYEPRNVWVAERPSVASEDPLLVSCVQVFPRRIRVGDDEVLAGGIGSVFTRPQWRRRGIAERLLEAAARSMRSRGFELSLLVATRVEWYRRLGWHPWLPDPGSEDTSGRSGRWRLTGSPVGARGASSVRIEDLDRERGFEQDLQDVARIAREYGRGLQGIVVRDHDDWRASLLLAGDPDETFLVARGREGVEAYLRLARLDGYWQALEWGRRSNAVAELVALFAAGINRAPPDARQSLKVPRVLDEVLLDALDRAGLTLEEEVWKGAGSRPTWMVRVLRKGDLARRAGCGPEIDGSDLLERLLPKALFHFWPADRF